jgi:hypothetical protein
MEATESLSTGSFDTSGLLIFIDTAGSRHGSMSTGVVGSIDDGRNGLHISRGLIGLSNARRMSTRSDVSDLIWAPSQAYLI